MADTPDDVHCQDKINHMQAQLNEAALWRQNARRVMTELLGHARGHLTSLRAAQMDAFITTA
jgi:hypothetical protein